MYLLAVNRDYTDEFARLFEVMFEINEPPGVDLGRYMNDRNGLKILLRTRILDDPDLDGQRAEVSLDKVEHYHRAADRWNVSAKFLPVRDVGLIFSKVHTVGPELQYAEIFVQFVKVLGLRAEWNPDRQDPSTHNHWFK